MNLHDAATAGDSAPTSIGRAQGAPLIGRSGLIPSPQAADHRIEAHVIEAVRRLAGAGVLPRGADSLGLDAVELTGLLDTVGVRQAPGESCGAGGEPAALLHPLIALLWEHRQRDGAWTRLMAGAIGCACFGEHHLWQDLDLLGRSEVSTLLTRHFPDLAAGNTRGLRWKRYLFFRLGDELGIEGLAPPRCEGCDDFQVCFPPHDNPALAIAPQSTR